MKSGETVAAFEREFSAYVGAKYAIALCNGTATLHTALVALGVGRYDRVAVPPLTMSATTIAVLHAGAVPVFVDVGPDTWLMDGFPVEVRAAVGVSLYGLHWPATFFDYRDGKRASGARGLVDDAAQTLAPMDYGPNNGRPDFKSYSFQSSKILALGEGGMLVTNDEELATRAREFSSLGYRMRADQPRIDPAVLKSPTYERHHTLGWNYRMSDLVAAEGLRQMDGPWKLTTRVLNRRQGAHMYARVVQGCDWLTPQHVPEGWGHDYWCYAVALDSAGRWEPLARAIVKHGGERPYAAWRLTYQESAFRDLLNAQDWGGVIGDAFCPVAEDLQPRLMQFQTNSLEAAERNANALRLAIRELGG